MKGEDRKKKELISELVELRKRVAELEKSEAERKRSEETLQYSHRFLKIANRHTQMIPLLKEFVAELKGFTGCAAVGIRILGEDEKIPYEAYDGFSQGFYESENLLSIKSDQCMCINVVRGTTDSKLPFYTKGGSFYMNGTTRFLATVSEEEKGKTRNVCNQFGYESVALVPIRFGGHILGLIHIADPREEKAPLKMVEILERLAMELGMAIQRVMAEEAMQQTFSQSRQYQAEVSALLDSTRGVLEFHEFKDTARSIFDSSKHFIGATAGYVALLSEDGMENEVLFLDSGDLPCTVDPNLTMPIRGLRGEAYCTGKTVFHNDFPRSEWVQYIPEGHARLDNVLFAPLTIKGKTVGVIGLANKPGGFNEDDARMASAFGELTSIALYNSRNLEELKTHRHHLEELVIKRTNELREVNEQLCKQIDERKKAEEILQLERNKLKSIHDAMPDGVYIVNQDFDIEYINPVIEKEFGPVKGRKCYDYFHDRKEVCPWCKNQEVFTGKSVQWEWNSPKTGKIYDLFDTPLRNTDGSISKLEFFHDITDLKGTEKALRQSEGLLKNVLETLPIGVWVTDKTGKILHGNLAGQKIWAGAKYVGIDQYGQYKGWWVDTGKRIEPDEWAAARAITKGESSLNEEVEIECFDGTHKIILNSAIPIRDVNQEIIGAIIVNQDIAERKRADEALRESEKKARFLADILEHSSQPFGIGNPDGSLGFLNSAFCELTGYSAEELRAMDWVMELTPPEWREHEEKMLAKLQPEVKPVRYEKEYIRKDGSRVPVELFVHQVSDATRAGPYYYAFVTDITERKRAEEAMRESETKYRIVAHNTYDWEFWLSPEGQFIYTSPSCKQVTGYDSEEFMVDSGLLNRIIHPDDRPIFDSHQVEAQQKEICGPVEFRIVRLDGTSCWIGHVCQPVFDKDGNFLGTRGSNRDITERKRVEEEKNKIQVQLFQSQKMDSIGTLAGGIAHDFNNLLTVIQGHSQMLMLEFDEADSHYQDLKEIQRASVRASNLTRQMLLFSRKQPMEFISLNLNETVDGLLKMLKRLIGEDMAISAELESNPWAAKGDQGNIEQVIMNLTINARDAMPNGGKIIIKTENVHIDESYCGVYPYAQPGNYICLSIKDTGVGMDKEVLQRIFEPFFTTKGVGKGTGLGLSVVYGIVKQHEGWINVESEPGQGSTFKIYLPATSVRPEDVAEKRVSLQDFQGGGERILVVEDEEGVLKFAKKTLVENGYTVFVAASAEEAINIFEKEKGNFQLVFSDVILPGKTGLELVDELFSHNPELKVLLSSGYTDPKSHLDFIQQRGFQFLQKPYNMDSLLKNIREIIEKAKGTQKRK